jgi:hypothetical protein
VCVEGVNCGRQGLAGGSRVLEACL